MAFVRALYKDSKMQKCQRCIDHDPKQPGGGRCPEGALALSTTPLSRFSIVMLSC